MDVSNHSLSVCTIQRCIHASSMHANIFEKLAFNKYTHHFKEYFCNLHILLVVEVVSERR